MKKLVLAAAAALLLTGLQAPPASPPPAKATLSLWRLDCGKLHISDFNARFSDTLAYKSGQAKDLVASCYLIQHGDTYMLWDTGLNTGVITNPVRTPTASQSLDRSIVDQLKQVNVRPDQIAFVGISHMHADHIGQAGSFPKAQLIIGKGDFDALKAGGPNLQPDLLKHWISGGGKANVATSDVDVFGDGSVVVLRTPGHTPGHQSLLVRLASRPVILSGDLYHFTEQVLLKGVPPFNFSRADTLASMDRIERLGRNLNARLIIGHEPDDIAKLPAFPAAAR
jgi:glyoxylase-like metal-dependent hydrolase (beta-lactamase superfamily II)